MRKLMEAVAILEYDDYDEENFDEENEHYDLKDAQIDKFEGRKIFVTDLYDGDVYGILDNKHGPRFMISAPLWRGEFPPSEVTEDEIEISSPTFDIDQNDADFLRRYYLADELSESVEIIGEAASSRQWEIAINNLIADGEERFSIAGATIEQKNTWNWVRDELHGMLDFQPDETPSFKNDLDAPAFLKRQAD